MKRFEEEMKKVMNKSSEVLKEFKIDAAKDDYTIIQPFNDSQAISIRVEGGGSERGVKVNVTDTTVVLPKIDDVLDIFGED